MDIWFTCRAKGAGENDTQVVTKSLWSLEDVLLCIYPRSREMAAKGSVNRQRCSGVSARENIYPAHTPPPRALRCPGAGSE